MEELMKLTEAAKIMGVSYQTALRLAKSGELDAVKFGPRSWRVSKAGIDAFKERNTFSKHAAMPKESDAAPTGERA